MQEFHYDIVGESQLIESYHAQYTYDIAIDQHARTTNYMYPTVAEQLHYNHTTTSPSYQGLRRSSAIYDNYGCMLENLEEIWDPTKQAYVKQKSTHSNYVQAAWGGEMLQDETFVDEVSGFQRKVSYTLTSDQNQFNLRSLNTKRAETRCSHGRPSQCSTMQTAESPRRQFLGLLVLTFPQEQWLPTSSKIAISMTRVVRHCFGNGSAGSCHGYEIRYEK